MGSKRPILDRTATAAIQSAMPATMPHQVTSAKISMADINAAKSTSSRSPPSRRCGLLADWWMTISRGLSIENPLQNRRAANAKQRGHEASAEYEKRDRQSRDARPASEFAQFAAEYECAAGDHQRDQRNGKGNGAGERLCNAVERRFPGQPAATAARE